MINRFAAPLAIAAVLSLGTAQAALAEDASEARDVATFSKIVTSGSADVHVRVGGDQTVVVRTDRKNLARVRTEVRGETLYIKMEEGRWWRKSNVDVDITVASLEGLEIDGSSDADITGVSSDHFELIINGSGDVEIDGSCGEAEIEIDGSGDIDAAAFKCQTVSIEINGSGDADLYASEQVTVDINGSGDIQLFGDPDKIRSEIKGSGSISG